MTFILAPMAIARSPSRYAGNVGIAIEPPGAFLAVFRTRSTASLMVMKKRVHSGSVTGTVSPAFRIVSQVGTTEPVDRQTLPYLTTEKCGPEFPRLLLAAMRRDSAKALLVP